MNRDRLYLSDEIYALANGINLMKRSVLFVGFYASFYLGD